MTKRNGFAISTIGSSHIRKNICCQDKSGYFGNSKYSAIVVCDGHGSEKHFRSNIGASLAVSIVKELLDSFSELVIKETAINRCLIRMKELEKNIIYHWRKAVESYMESNPFIDSELCLLNDANKREVLQNFFLAYGTTFLCVAEIGNFVYIVQLGDGNCVLVKDNSIVFPVETDDRLKFNFTTSLCADDAFNNIRDKVLPVEAGTIFVLTSDGVYNSFENEEAYVDFVKTVCENTASNELNTELQDFLPKLSKNGSGDDVSLAILF